MRKSSPDPWELLSLDKGQYWYANGQQLQETYHEES
jgi:hypothetical protein